MALQIDDTSKNSRSFDEMTTKKADTASQISSQQIKIPASSQDKPNNKIDDIEDTEVKDVEPTFQRRPQFRLNDNNRRRFY